MSNVKRGRKPKYNHTIYLEGINARNVYKKYKQKRDELMGSVGLEHPPITPLIELPVGPPMTLEKTPFVTMADYLTYGCMPEHTDIRCMHDHHTFTTSPIGLPIRYIKHRPDKIALGNDFDTDIFSHSRGGTNDYFLTSGVFCSFPCCLAFLKDHANDPLFKNSKSLLYSLYFKLFSIEMQAKAAPSWKTLKVYGGQLSIEEFRASFCVLNYTIGPTIKRPYMVAVGHYVD